MVMRLAIQRTILNQGLAIWALSRLYSGLAMKQRLAMEHLLALKKAMVNQGLAVGALSKGVEVMEVLGHGGRQEEMAKYMEPTRGEL